MVSHFVVVMVLTAPPLEPLVSPDEFTARGLVTFAPSIQNGRGHHSFKAVTSDRNE